MIKASQIVKDVKELAAEHPNRKAGCKNFHANGRPCCIVGHALHKHGVRLKDLFGRGLNENGLVALKVYKVIENDLSDQDWMKLQYVQNAQDKGRPWGEAIKELA